MNSIFCFIINILASRGNVNKYVKEASKDSDQTPDLKYSRESDVSTTIRSQTVTYRSARERLTLKSAELKESILKDCSSEESFFSELASSHSLWIELGRLYDIFLEIEQRTFDDDMMLKCIKAQTKLKELTKLRLDSLEDRIKYAIVNFAPNIKTVGLKEPTVEEIEKWSQIHKVSNDEVIKAVFKQHLKKVIDLFNLKHEEMMGVINNKKYSLGGNDNKTDKIKKIWYGAANCWLILKQISEKIDITADEKQCIDDFAHVAISIVDYWIYKPKPVTETKEMK